MSRIGKKPVPLPEGVKAALDGRRLSVSGPKGSLAMVLSPGIDVTQDAGGLAVAPQEGPGRAGSAAWGLQRSLIANMVAGVSKGFTRELEINGVGFRAQIQGKTLRLGLGFSHDVDYPIPEGIEIACPRPTLISVSGADRQKVGQTAAEIRAFRPPEPYKGKGVRYAGEYVFRKEGKKK